MRSDGGAFELTPKVITLGTAYVASLGLWELARPHLETLVRTTGESSSMAQLDGSDIVYVARVSVPKIIALRVDIGTLFPAQQTSQGKVLLAALTPEELNAALAIPSRSGLPTYIGRTRSELDQELVRVRARGWALADEELAPGVRSVAVPVRDGAGVVRAAMNVTVHAAETTTEQAAGPAPASPPASGRRRERRLGSVAVQAACLRILGSRRRGDELSRSAVRSPGLASLMSWGSSGEFCESDCLQDRWVAAVLAYLGAPS